MKGKRVSVISTLQTQPPMVADELRRQADLETMICRDPAARPMRDGRDGRDGRADGRDGRSFAPRGANHNHTARDGNFQDDDLAEEV